LYAAFAARFTTTDSVLSMAASLMGVTVIVALAAPAGIVRAVPIEL
jgi:hypothetical protein